MIKQNISVILQHFAVIGLAFLFYYIDLFNLIEVHTHHILFLSVATLKSTYFLKHSFRKVKELSESDHSFQHFMWMMLINISLIVVSYAADFFTLFQIYSDSFTGITSPNNPLKTFLEFLYFSITTFSTTGIGDIQPVFLSAKYLVCLEVILAFITIVFLFAHFVNLKETKRKVGD